MNKLIIIFILFFSATLYSGGIFYSSIEFAYYPILIQQDRFNVGIDETNNFSATILGGAEYKFLYAEAELNTFMIKSESYMFQPYTQEYYVRAGIRIDIFELGYEHLCAHSVDSLGDNYGHDKVYLNFDTRRK